MFCSLTAVHGYPLFACLWQRATVLCSWLRLVAHLYTGNTVFNFHGNTSGIFTLLTVACSSTVHRMHFFISMSWWLMTHLSEFRSTSGTLTRCIYFSHILLTGFKRFFIALHSQEHWCNGCCPSSNCVCNGASCETHIILGKVCFVFYMHWRNYILCGCNISRSTQTVNKLFLFLQAIFTLRPHYVQWIVTTCLSFVYMPTDMELVLQWSRWNFIKENMFYSWFQTFDMFWMLCAFFWVIPRRLIFICQRFGTLFHLHRQVDMMYFMPTCLWRYITDSVFWNVGI